MLWEGTDMAVEFDRLPKEAELWPTICLCNFQCPPSLWLKWPGREKWAETQREGSQQSEYENSRKQAIKKSRARILAKIKNLAKMKNRDQESLPRSRSRIVPFKYQES